MDFNELLKSKEDALGLEKMLSMLSQIHTEVKKMYSDDSPLLGNVDEFNYSDYLNDKEINQKPIEVQEIIKSLTDLFRGLPVWANSGTMLNVIPPVNILSVAMASYANLLNVNYSQDKYAGLLMAAELEVIKYISQMVDWDWKKSSGLFTFGGKGTNIYGLKCAINRAYPEGKYEGYYGKKFFYISSIKGHPCHEEASVLLGIGSNNCVKILCSQDGKILIDKTKEAIEKNIEEGKTFLGFNLCGGSTVEFEIDDIKAISELRDKIVKKYNLSYSPMIHVDSVVGWPWLFFKYYDFDKNPLQMDKDVLQRTYDMYCDISGIKYADTFGCDFHKSGFCPYISSLFMTKDRNDLLNLSHEGYYINKEDLEFGNYSPFEYSIELTRSAQGPLAALAAIKSFGVEGYQKMLCNLMMNAKYLRSQLKKLNFVELLNEQSRGVATLFVVKPPKFEKFSLPQLLKLELKDTDEIKDYNVKLGRYIDYLSMQKQSRFVMTATDAFAVNNTNVFMGMMKAYPMSPLITEEDIDSIVENLKNIKDKFDNGGINDVKILKHAPSDMVYRK